MPKLADRIKETTTTTGTGAVSLGGAAAGYRAFSAAFVSGDPVYYCIEGGAEWEVGIGTLASGAPWTLARTSVLASSNAGGLVLFSAGTKSVFCPAPAAVFPSPPKTAAYNLIKRLFGESVADAATLAN